jgi:hypothetical protein
MTKQDPESDVVGKSSSTSSLSSTATFPPDPLSRRPQFGSSIANALKGEPLSDSPALISALEVLWRGQTENS